MVVTVDQGRSRVLSTGGVIKNDAVRSDGRE